MQKETSFTYSNALGTIHFAYDSDYWISNISGMETDVSMTTSQSAGQRGTTVNEQSVQPKKLTVNGSISGDVEAHRAAILSVAVPKVQSKLTITQGGENWSLDGYPTKTPLFSDGAALQEFQFTFYAPYPYFKQDLKRYELAGLAARWRTPFNTGGTHYISKFTTDMFRPIANDGNIAQAFTVTLSASAELSRPVIHNASKNTLIRIDKTLAAGERFVISTADADKDAGNGVLYYDAAGVRHNGYKYVTLDSDLNMRVSVGGDIFLADAQTHKSNLRCVIMVAGGERHSL
ncbi:MAG: phage tail family protein [Ruthenibacterium sp.]